MSDEPGSPSPSEKAFVNDLPQLEQELAQRCGSNAVALPAEEHRRLVAGLLAGMTFVSRPREMHRTMERLPNARVSPAEAARLVP